MTPRQPLALPWSSIRRVVSMGLLAGTLDILAAIVDVKIRLNSGPVAVLKYIASGALGEAAFSSGLGTAIVGLLFHYLIATFWAFLFFATYSKSIRWIKNRAVMSVLYGLLIWLVMNIVVVPLSRVVHGPFSYFQAIKGMLILIVAVSLPIVLMTHRYHASGLRTTGGSNTDA